MKSDWMDVSVPLRTGMVHWPDNPPVVIDHQLDMARGDVCTVSRLSFGAHTGTHMDAPAHFISGGKGIDEMPLTACMGRARVVAIQDPTAITAEELRGHAVMPGERLLFKTRNSACCWQTNDFVENFVYIAQDAARYLAEREVQTVGVDYLSVGGFFRDGPETHRALLEAGIWIIEGLNLSGVEPGDYELICLPLHIVGADGAPARALLRRADTTGRTE